MPSCAVFGCHSHSRHLKRDQFSLYRFPVKNKTLLQQWIRVCGRPSQIPVENARVCSRHFTAADYTQAYNIKTKLFNSIPRKIRPLKDSAVPTQHLPDLNSDSEVMAEQGCIKQEKGDSSEQLVPQASLNMASEEELSMDCVKMEVEVKEEPLIFPDLMPAEQCVTEEVCEFTTAHFQDSQDPFYLSSSTQSKKLLNQQNVHQETVADAAVSLETKLAQHKRSHQTTLSKSTELPKQKRTCPDKPVLPESSSQSVRDGEQCRHHRQFSNLDDLQDKLEWLDTLYWTVSRQQDSLIIYHIVHVPSPKLLLAVKINNNCIVHVFAHEVAVHAVGDYIVPSVINNVDKLEELLTHLSKLDIKQDTIPNTSNFIAVLHLVISMLSALCEQAGDHVCTLYFICEQLKMMTLSKMQYPPELMVFSYILHHCSEQGYKLLKNSKYLILPSISTIRRITLLESLNPKIFLKYIKNRFRTLEESDKVVILMLNEIQLKSCLDDKARTVDGSVSDSSGAATSAFVFMLNGLCSSFKDIVHIVPTKLMEAETLNFIMKQLIIGLEEIGFRVVCVVTDTNAISRNTLSHFSSPPKLSIVYQHPADSKRPLFFMFNVFHILKCVSSEWLAKSGTSKWMTFPEFSIKGYHAGSAPFSTLRKLYCLEADSILKHSSQLIPRSCSPSSLETQNANLAILIFNYFIAGKLISVGKKYQLPYYKQVAEYINIISTWWTIMNVKSTDKDCQLNNPYAVPLTGDGSDINCKFLNSFYDWLELWQGNKNIIGKLSTDLFTAFKHTTHAMIEIRNYCIDELKMNAVLTGRFQMDDLGARFHEARQQAGVHNNLSLQQMFQCEQNLRKFSVMKKYLPHQYLAIQIIKFPDINWVGLDAKSRVNADELAINVTQDDVASCQEYLPEITYLAGYCCLSVCQKIACKFCKDSITCTSSKDTGLGGDDRFIERIVRCSILYPVQAVINIVVYNYIVVHKYIHHPSFSKLQIQNTLVTDITLDALADDDALLKYDTCTGGHDLHRVEKLIVWASSQCLLNNFCVINKEVIYHSILDSEEKTSLCLDCGKKCTPKSLKRHQLINHKEIS